MSAFVHVRLHLVWSTKDRLPKIKPAWQDELYCYFHGICENISCKLIKAGGVTDHVHAYVSVDAMTAVGELVRALKANSSRWIRTKYDPTFAWQTNYAAFSVSQSAAETLLAYIAQQRKHHEKRSFAQELEALLRRHGSAFDRRYYLE